MKRATWFTLVAYGWLMPTVARAAEPAEGGGDPASQLMPDWASALFNLLMFLALVFVLGKFVWPKILEGLQARERKIEDDLNTAERNRRAAAKLKEDFERKIAEAHAESRKLLDQTRADADQLRAKLKQDTEAEMASLRQRASEEINLAKQQALSDLHAHAADLATMVAGKVIGRQIQDDDTQRLVDESLEELNRLN